MFNSSQFSAFATFYIYVQPFYIYVQQIGDRSKHCVEVFWFMYIYIWCQYMVVYGCMCKPASDYVCEWVLVHFFFQDYLILDEGHKIKNPTKTTKGVHQIPAGHRILLTGTPIQNNLRVPQS